MGEGWVDGWERGGWMGFEFARGEDKEDKGGASEKSRRVCVCLLLQDLLQSCARWGRGIVEDMCYEIRRAEACVE